MEHDEAARSHAAERYVAHELSPAEREAFEAHFFECPQCAAEVSFELSFPAAVRTASRLPQEPQRAAAPAGDTSVKRWWDWLGHRPVMAFSFAANVVLIGGIGFFMLAGARRPAAPRFTEPYFAPGPTHGAADVHVMGSGDALYAIRFPASGAGSRMYNYEVLDAHGRREASGSLPAPASGDGFLYLQIPIGDLPSGIHTLVVRAGSDSDIISWSRFSTAR